MVLVAAGDKSDGSTLASEFKGSGVADAAAGAGDDRDGSAKSVSHGSVLFIQGPKWAWRSFGTNSARGR